ncbi:MAG TPA: ATP-binding protein [Kofleriaceae bacterium]
MPLLAILATEEQARLEALRECRILNSDPDPEFDTLVAHAGRLTRSPIALLSLVDESRQWFKARIGVSATHTPRSLSFCAHTIRQMTPMIVSDARLDPRFADNPLVTGDPYIVFYAGWPLITPDGHALGSLCVIDHEPRVLTATQQEAMALLARQVVLSLELRRAVSRGAEIVSPLSELATREAEREAGQAARTRMAQLIVHDLKNPLTVIGANATYVLESGTVDPSSADALRDVLGAAARMQAMLLDLLDTSREAAGDGKLIARKRPVELAALVSSVVGHSPRLDVDVDPELTLTADPSLLTRLLENLLDNAQRHAPSGSAITISAQRTRDGVLLSVADLGPGIADLHKHRIFDRYVQLDASTKRTGRGLGLVFCKLAAEAHDGAIYVEDNRPRGARFCVSLPDR